MSTFTVEIETPLGVKQFGFAPFSDAEAVRTHAKLLQVRLNSDGQPMMPAGEITVYEGDPGDPLNKRPELAAGAAKLGFDQPMAPVPPSWQEKLAKPEDEIAAAEDAKHKHKKHK